MAVRARSKGLGISAKKMRIVCDMVRGKDIASAVSMLRFTQSPSAEIVMKTINSAVANAENNDFMNRDSLHVSRITVDEGPRLKRIRPRARGRAGSFNRPSCHLIVEVDDVTANSEGGE
ncbi:MAG: 50S ribosomal protein L22 [Chloroflexi bacterium]|nr:50S ribosomal protein L22 [Chloroflexota bacterium]